MLIGRQQEIRLVRAAIGSGLNLLLEGPVGVGKTRLVLEALADLGRPTFRVDGDERFSEQKMAGWFDPAAVMKLGYRPEHFIPGPLYRAMSEGGILFINEMNRLPESVQNLLLPALDERLLQVPMLGEVRAAAGFQVIATMNPREFVATSELSEALRDRFELLRIDYQGEDEERAIVRQQLQAEGPNGGLALDGEDLDGLLGRAVELVRRTRGDQLFRRGASVRAAISLTRLALSLGATDEAFDQAARLALGSRIEAAEDAKQDAADTLGQWLEEQKKKPVHPLN